MYFLFDIGGTKTRVGVSIDKKTVSAQKIFDTPRDFNEGVNLIILAAKELSGEQEITAIGGGIGAPLNKNKSAIAESYANFNKSLANWAGKPLKEVLEKELGAPVFLENDTIVIGLAEATQIENYQEKIIAYYTVSTGVGGSLITFGKITPHSSGFEPGSQIIDPTGAICPTCEKPGRLEDLIGGDYIKARTGKMPAEIDDEEFWKDAARSLALGLINSAVHWSPDIIVIGGSLMNKISLQEVEKYFIENLTIFSQLPKLMPAQLDELGGLRGAALFLNLKLSS
jgi:predicted NBD/HSP70 family sugar kinase